MRIKRKTEKGQVALVVLLVSAVTLMLGLTASRKSTIDISIGHDQELSAKAFAAAEAGLEYALSEISADNIDSSYYWDSPAAGSEASVLLSELGGGGSYYPSDTYQPGEMAYFWLRNPTDFSEYYSPRTIGLCWESGSDQAFVAHLFYNNGSYAVVRGAVDEDAGRRGLNGFAAPSGSVTCDSGFEGSIYDFTANVGVNEVMLLVIMPLYESTRLGIVSTGGNIPAQGYEITSTGTSANVSRALLMNYGWPIPPYYMVDGVFSGTSVTGN